MWYHLYVNLEKGYKWTYIQNRKRVIDVDNKLRSVLWIEIMIPKLEYASESLAKLIKIQITGPYTKRLGFQ